MKQMKTNTKGRMKNNEDKEEYKPVYVVISICNDVLCIKQLK